MRCPYWDCGWCANAATGQNACPGSDKCNYYKENIMDHGHSLPIERVPVKESVPGGSTPSQYALPDDATELQDLINYRNLNFAMGNCLKAIYRMNHCAHSDRERDLNKIIFFAKAEIERIKKYE